nr:tryptophan 2,3-dioxygenase family protein [Angustibacter aerolatus]
MQFREVEFLSGHKDPSFLDRFRGLREADRERLRRRLAEPSLWDAFVSALGAAGLDVGDEEGLRASLLAVARDRGRYGDLWELAECLLVHDEQQAAWRARHVTMVERQIGTKSGTGGSTGAPYLRSRLPLRFYPLLWEPARRPLSRWLLQGDRPRGARGPAAVVRSASAARRGAAPAAGVRARGGNRSRGTGVMAQPARSRQQLIDSAAGLTGHADREAVTTALARYYRHVPDDDLLVRRPEDLLGALTSHRELAARRRPGTARVRAYTPSVDEHRLDVRPHGGRGRHRRHAVPRRLGDRRADPAGPRDPPRRAPAGSWSGATRRASLLEVLDRSATDPAGLPEGAAVESWMHVEIDRETDQADLDGLVADVRRVLGDVRAAVEDWRPMREAAERLAAEARRGAAVGRPRRGGRDPPAAALAGRRRLHVRGLPRVRARGRRRRRLAAVGARHRPRGAAWRAAAQRRLRPAPRPGARAGRRPAAAHPDQGQQPLDRAPAGVPRLRRGEGVRRRGAGHRRAAVPGPVHLGGLHRERHPGAGHRHQGAGDPAPQRVPPREPLRQGPAGDPRDVPARRACSRRASTTCTRRRPACCTCRSAGAPSLFLRRDDYGRFMSCLVYLPRDRYTTQMRLRMEEILREAFEGRASTTPRASPSRCSPACTSSSGCRAGRCCPTSTPPRWRSGSSPPPAPGTRTSPSRCGWRWARRRRRACRPCTAARSPRRTRRTSPPGSRSPTCATSPRWTPPARSSPAPTRG